MKKSKNLRCGGPLAGALLLATLTATPAQACDLEPIAAVGVFYSTDYRYYDVHMPALIPTVGPVVGPYQSLPPAEPITIGKYKSWDSPIGKLRVGVECGPVAVVAEHFDSLATRRDPGMTFIGVEVDLVHLLKGE